MEAEPVARRALALRLKALGTKHPDTAAALHSLANLLYCQGAPSVRPSPRAAS